MHEASQKVLSVLSHDTRVRVIELLGARAQGIAELEAQMHVDGLAIRNHVAHLINNDLCFTQREGRRVRYWLNRTRLAEVLQELGLSVGIRVTLDEYFMQETPELEPVAPRKKTGAKRKPKAVEPEPKKNVTATSKAQFKAQLKAEPNPEAKAKAKAKPELRAKAKAKLELEAKPQAKPKRRR
jgi:hypothetical protein